MGDQSDEKTQLRQFGLSKRDNSLRVGRLILSWSRYWHKLVWNIRSEGRQSCLPTLLCLWLLPPCLLSLPYLTN